MRGLLGNTTRDARVRLVSSVLVWRNLRCSSVPPTLVLHSTSAPVQQQHPPLAPTHGSPAHQAAQHSTASCMASCTTNLGGIPGMGWASLLCPGLGPQTRGRAPPLLQGELALRCEWFLDAGPCPLAGGGHVAQWPSSAAIGWRPPNLEKPPTFPRVKVPGGNCLGVCSCCGRGTNWASHARRAHSPPTAWNECRSTRLDDTNID